MAQFIVIIIALFFTYKIFKNKGNYMSVVWVLSGMLLLNDDIVIVYFPMKINTWQWLTFSLLFIELYRWRNFRKEFISFPLKTPFIILVIALFSIAILDSRLSLFYKFYSPFQEIIYKSLLLFLGYFAIQQKDDLQKLIKPLFLVLCIITIYGLYNWIFQQNSYFEWVITNFFQRGNDSVAELDLRMRMLKDLDRYHAVSTFHLSFDYGYASALLSVIFFALYNLYSNKRTDTNKIFKIAYLLGLTGAVISASRTILFAWIVAMVVLILFSTNISKKISLSLSFIMVVIIAYSIIPPFQMAINNLFDIFINGGTAVIGTTTDFKWRQMAGTYKYFLQAPILGNGFGYINKELGWGDKDNAILDADMFGFESIIIQLIIEQGIVGLLVFFIFVISIIVFFWKNRKKTRLLSGLGLSVITLFLVFSIGTGPLRSWPMTMIFTGVLVKTIVLSNQYYHKMQINQNIKI